MKFILSFLIIVSITLVIITQSACTSDNEEELAGPCDTVNVKFHEIVYIFEKYCYECHTQEYNFAGVKTDRYNDVKQVAVSGKLWGVLSHLPGYKPMPNGRPQIPYCELNKIKSWIDNGMQP